MQTGSAGKRIHLLLELRNSIELFLRIHQCVRHFTKLADITHLLRQILHLLLNVGNLLNLLL